MADRFRSADFAGETHSTTPQTQWSSSCIIATRHSLHVKNGAKDKTSSNTTAACTCGVHNGYNCTIASGFWTDGSPSSPMCAHQDLGSQLDPVRLQQSLSTVSLLSRTLFFGTQTNERKVNKFVTTAKKLTKWELRSVSVPVADPLRLPHRDSIYHLTTASETHSELVTHAKCHCEIPHHKRSSSIDGVVQEFSSGRSPGVNRGLDLMRSFWCIRQFRELK